MVYGEILTWFQVINSGGKAHAMVWNVLFLASQNILTLLIIKLDDNFFVKAVSSIFLQKVIIGTANKYRNFIIALDQSDSRTQLCHVRISIEFKVHVMEDDFLEFCLK